MGELEGELGSLVGSEGSDGLCDCGEDFEDEYDLEDLGMLF